MTAAAEVQNGRQPQQPLVSILTPSFNQRAWLAESLSSVASQTYPQLEHIVVDGGSTDGSVEILRAALPAESWTSEPDNGQSEALNKAFARSRGEIIGWVNSDDAYLFDDVVETVVAYFDAHPDVDVAYGHAALMSETGQLLQVMWTPPYRPGILRRSNFIVQPAAFIRRRVLEERFLDESFHYTMDHELWLRLARNHSFGRIDRVLAIDRHQAGRKGYVRPDLAHEELVRLSELYGIGVTRTAFAERKLRRIGYRFRGAPTAFRLRPDRKAFAWSLDGHGHLLVRQLVLKRRFMRAHELGAT